MSSSVTALAGTVDTLTVGDGANETVLFSVAGGTDYFLFVQGGTAGTSDDSIIGLGNVGTGVLASTNSAMQLTFSGTGA